MDETNKVNYCIRSSNVFTTLLAKSQNQILLSYIDIIAKHAYLSKANT